MRTIADDAAPDDFLWNGEPLRGLCGHCKVHVDSTDPNHRVTSIVAGGRGVECVLRGDIAPADGGPLDAGLLCPVGGTHEWAELEEHGTGRRFVGCENCDATPPAYDEDGFAIPKRRRVPTS